MPVTLADIRAARRRIAGGVLVTPCAESIPLSEITGARIFCKLDSFQRTGWFKERGARNALLRLTPTARRRGVVAASAGNHALGLAYHGRLLGIPVTVVMPDYAPLIKITTSQRLGAQVLIHGRDFADACAQADALAAQHGYTYIHGFDAPDIIAGRTGLRARRTSCLRSCHARVWPLVWLRGSLPPMAGTRFEWDDKKDVENQAKHHVAFAEAQFAFADPSRVIARDQSHSRSEERFYCFGRVTAGVLTVRFTYRQGVIRIIGAGYWRKGKAVYEQENQVHE
jgi:uncharacterized DUF497 family protein